MTLEFLGVGSAFAKENYQNNLLINGNILIDCGASVGRSLYDTGRSFKNIDHIFITHTHSDHIGGMEECAFLNKFFYNERKITLHLPPELITPIWEHSLKGGLKDISNENRHLEDYFEIREASRCFQIEGVQFEIIPTYHVPGKFCCGLKINNRIYFSGDTQFVPEMVEQHGTNAEIIYHDCQFFTGGIHASLEELTSLPKNLRCKTWLMHYSDNHADHKDKAKKSEFRWTKQHAIYTFGD